jgi:predicted glycoside hydrolase/deacetylase ChbG (UPF0249 family)
MMHPGYPDGSLERMRTRLRQQRADEVALLTAAGLRSVLADGEIALLRSDGRRAGHHAA